MSKPSSRVIWSEGLLITPQHMQQLDRFHEHRLQSWLDAVHAESWGVVSVELDAPALETGTVALKRFEGVLPDGTLLGIDEASGDRPAARPVEGHFAPNQAVLEVFLGVLRAHDGRSNVGTDKTETSRYYQASETAYDRFGDAPPEELALARPNLRVLFGTEPREDYSLIKIAEVRRAGTGQLVESSDYIPPCLNVGASPVLATSFESLLTTMNARRAELLEGVRHRGRRAEFSAEDVNRYLVLNTLNGLVPIIKHLAVAGDVAPKAAYFAVAQLAGQLATFSTDFDPNDVPKFDYRDLRFTFGTLIGIVRRLLQATLEDRFLSIPFVASGNGLHVATVEDDRFVQCREFYLGVESSTPGPEVAAKLPSLAKLASPGDIKSLLALSVPGVALQAEIKPPAEIPTREGVSYFKIHASGDYWQNIVLERKLNMYLPSPFTAPDVRIQLLGILS